jgi:hypothetical protein
LLSNTAVPLWNRSRRWLPFVFAGSAAASTACLLLPFADDAREERVLRRLLVGGLVVEAVSKQLLEKEVGTGPTGRALRRGPMASVWTGAKILAAATLLSALVPGRGGRTLTAVLGTAAAVASRFAIHEAGRRSSLDPRAAFEQE